MENQLPPHISDPTVCCCCEAARRRQGRRRFRIRFFTDEEEAELLAAADAWNRDTGRSCGDFFKTLTIGAGANKALAGRPTLLTKVLTIGALELLAAGRTICANLPVPPGRYEVRRFEVSGFGFSRPVIGRFRSLEAARAICDDFIQKHPYPSLESCHIVDIETAETIA